MTIEQLRAWLRDWVAQATGVSPEEILDSKPLENYGLSSRDAVVPVSYTHLRAHET